MIHVMTVYSKGTLFDLLDPNSTRLHLLGILENAIIIQISAHTPSQDMDDEAERLFKTMSKACRLRFSEPKGAKNIFQDETPGTVDRFRIIIHTLEDYSDPICIYIH